MTKYYLQPLEASATGDADAYYRVRLPADYRGELLGRIHYGMSPHPYLQGDEIVTIRPAIVVAAKHAEADAIPLPGARTKAEARRIAPSVAAQLDKSYAELAE